MTFTMASTSQAKFQLKTPCPGRIWSVSPFPEHIDHEMGMAVDDFRMFGKTGTKGYRINGIR
ncbi:hypothetical protein [Maribacter polysaccharolyticus]|uniref:hypothetical protein n=1 Tax=Maribacter polysaccharolyticus TaxID=3020831 RepID=UPI00237F62F2|nr:hypothetical protein [Maribacter polysaccharolyticus]MDE3743257.1 hypothetical protein [Maribacter polysaccharolyticus]